MKNCICETAIDRFAAHLHAEERAPQTVEKYVRDVRAFCAWQGGQGKTGTAGKNAYKGFWFFGNGYHYGEDGGKGGDGG